MASIDKKIIGSAKEKRAYFCKSTNTLKLDTEDDSNRDFNFTLALKDFKVQSFGFKPNATDIGTGMFFWLSFFVVVIVAFCIVSRCSQDIKGSKIVPIAVGAALAGLVVIVLIAYIIGRLRSRRQSSYEALS